MYGKHKTIHTLSGGLYNTVPDPNCQCILCTDARKKDEHICPSCGVLFTHPQPCGNPRDLLCDPCVQLRIQRSMQGMQNACYSNSPAMNAKLQNAIIDTKKNFDMKPITQAQLKYVKILIEKRNWTVGRFLSELMRNQIVTNVWMEREANLFDDHTNDDNLTRLTIGEASLAINWLVQTEGGVKESKSKVQYLIKVESDFIPSPTFLKGKLGAGFSILTVEKVDTTKPLDTPATAVQEIVRIGYRTLARQNHPDLVGAAKGDSMVNLTVGKRQLDELLDMVGDQNQ